MLSERTSLIAVFLSLTNTFFFLGVRDLALKEYIGSGNFCLLYCEVLR